jgi:hypothetical protein
MPDIPSKLGKKVHTREINWLAQVERAWGSEFNAPDHGIYEFSNSRKFDSTDMGRTGVYGVSGENILLAEGVRYPDMRDGILENFTNPNGSLNQPFGSFDEFIPENNPIPSPFAPPPTVETDPYFSNVILLVHNDFTDKSQYAAPFVNVNNRISIATNAPAHLGDTQALAQLADVQTVAGDTGVGQFSGAQFNLPSPNQPWTLEYSICLTAGSPGFQQYFMDWGVNGIYHYFNNATNFSQAVYAAFSINPPTLGRWYQIAVTYSGFNGSSLGVLRGFVDGVFQSASTVGPGATVYNSLGLFNYIGGSGFRCLRGYLKEIRLTKGIQRYGANYTPRTTPFPNQ